MMLQKRLRIIDVLCVALSLGGSVAMDATGGAADHSLEDGLSLLQFAKSHLASASGRLDELKVLANQAYVDGETESHDQQFRLLLEQLNSESTGCKWKGKPIFRGTLGYATTDGWVAPGLYDINQVKLGELDSSPPRGHNSGTVTEVKVRPNDTRYDVSVFLGAREFRNTVDATPILRTLVLTDTADPDNVIALQYESSSYLRSLREKSHAISSAEIFEQTLKFILRCEFDNPAVFVSESSGFQKDLMLVPGLDAPQGIYALTYKVKNSSEAVGAFKITDGIRALEVGVDKISRSMTLRVDFPNNISLLLSKFDGMRPRTQVTFSISGNQSLSYPIHYKSTQDEIKELRFKPLTISSLDMYGLSVSTSVQARLSLKRLERANQSVKRREEKIEKQERELRELLLLG